MADPTLLGALTATLEKLVNGALRYDPGTQAALAKLAGKVLAVESTFPPLTFYLLPQPATADVHLAVHAYCDLPPDTRLKGSLPAILALTLGPRHSLANSGVQVSGNPALLADLQAILANLDIDWEEPITDFLGTSIGHPFAELVRTQWQWTRNNVQKAQVALGDYLTEELRATPSKIELELFCAQVDQARAHSERLAARVQRLREHFGNGGGD